MTCQFCGGSGSPNSHSCVYCMPNDPHPLPDPNATFSAPLPPAPVGCICPPTSEQTCQNPVCPRQCPAVDAAIDMAKA